MEKSNLSVTIILRFGHGSISNERLNVRCTVHNAQCTGKERESIAQTAHIIQAKKFNAQCSKSQNSKHKLKMTQCIMKTQQPIAPIFYAVRSNDNVEKYRNKTTTTKKDNICYKFSQ